MSAGLCKFFDEDREFGFIVPSDGGPDVFFHRSKLLDEHELGLPEKHQLVEFEVTKRGEKVYAVRVRRITKEEAQ